MSYLDAPRLHFRGWFQADVSTINNKVQAYQNASFEPAYQELDPDSGNWNPQGTGIFRLLDCNVTGGFLDGRQLASAADDPVIGMGLQNAGDRAPGKLVDLDPQQQMVSEIWGMQVRLVDAAARALFQGEYKPAPFTGLWQRQQTGVMLDQTLAAYYQSVLEDVRWADALGSPLLDALKAATRDGMLSIQFNVFGYGRDPKIPRYTQGHAVGTIGPYRSGEPRLFVSGRQMIASLNMQTMQTAGGVQGLQAKVADDGTSITLDFGNALPIETADSGLKDIGEILVAVSTGNPDAPLATVGAADVVLIGKLDYTAPGWYTRTAGVQTFALGQNARVRQLLPDHPLLLLAPQADGAGGYKVLLQESIGGDYVRADQFVFRIDPGETQQVRLHATRFGAPLADADIAFHPDNRMLMTGGGPVEPPANPPAAIPKVGTPPEALTHPARVRTDAAGWATLPLTASADGPGTPRGYIAGQLYGIGYKLADQPAQYIANGFNFLSVLAYSRTAVPDAPTWWQDIRPMFVQYGNLYPIMSRYVVDLGDYDAVVQHLRILRLAFALPRFDANHMPVTRDLSTGARDTILKWLDSRGADGLPLRGTPPSAQAAAPQPAATVPAAAGGILPEQKGGKTAVILELAQRQAAASNAGNKP